MLPGASRRQHCTGNETTLHKKLPLQYWPTVHSPVNVVWIHLTQRCPEQITCAMLAESAAIFSEEDNLCYNVALQEILQGPTFYKKLPMYEPQSTNNSAQENNLQFCLGLSRPTLHEEITGAMLAHMLTMFMRKVTYIMLYRPFCGNIA